jgi:hypothetical protein
LTIETPKHILRMSQAQLYSLAQENYMKSVLFVSAGVLLGLMVFCSPLLAHHGNAAFAEKPITLKDAKVTNFAWANPHSLIEFDAKDDKGKVQHWVVETAAPQALVLIGWTKTSLQPGDIITVTAYQAKTGSPAARLQKIVLADGTELHDTQLGADGGGKTRYNNPDGGTPNTGNPGK